MKRNGNLIQIQLLQVQDISIEKYNNEKNVMMGRNIIMWRIQSQGKIRSMREIKLQRNKIMRRNVVEIK